MNYLYYDLYTNSGDIIEVSLDNQAYVRLLDDINFSRYRNGQRHSFYGGLVKITPYRMSPPYSGRWYLIIDLGGHAGTVNASVKILKG